MKIAFTHNLKLTNSEEEAEFDTRDTVNSISRWLFNLGHEVELIEVSGPGSRTIARLEAISPDLIFNTAEGRIGRYREAFYPGIFEQLGIPYTGSDAYTCMLTLDKNLTKLFLDQHEILTPRAAFIYDMRDAEGMQLGFPVIIKPNFEGSSKGITQDSLAETREEALSKIGALLKKYPSGLLVEEYIAGKDVAVPYLEGVIGRTHGVLPSVEYVFDSKVTDNRKFVIYDYELKNSLSHHVDVRTPADLPAEVEKKLQKASATIFHVLGVRDVGRIDFRVTPDHRPYFLEINALPSLEPGAGIYSSAATAGLTTPEQVLESVIRSACRRWGLDPKKKTTRRRQGPLRIGFSFNQKRIIPGADPLTDQEAEYDSPKTLDAIREAIRSYGHEVIDLEAKSDLPSVLAASNVDLVFNIAEGIRGRNRESQVPALLELLDIPYTGSDAATMAITLDKAIAKRMVRDAGVATPKFFTLITGKEKIPPEMTFPMIVKPVAEGSSKGVIGKSVVHTEAELRETAHEIIRRYRQAALAEAFLPGREFTVALLGERRVRVLPPMEIVFTRAEEKWPVYSYQHKLDANTEVRYQVPAEIDAKLKSEIERVAKAAFTALGCRDYARIDFRLDGDGRVNFIECNPLPGLTPGWSDLCLITESIGMSYRELIGEILAPAMRRYREKKKNQLEPPKLPEAYPHA